MESNTNLYNLLEAVSDDLTADELLLAGLKGMVSAAIAIKRQELNMSQKEFAASMGVSQGLVSRWESGDENFTLESLVKIAQKLSIKIQSPFVVA